MEKTLILNFFKMTVDDRILYGFAKNNLHPEYKKNGLPIHGFFQIDWLGIVEIYFSEKASQNLRDLEYRLSWGKNLGVSIFSEPKEVFDLELWSNDQISYMALP